MRISITKTSIALAIACSAILPQAKAELFFKDFGLADLGGNYEYNAWDVFSGSRPWAPDHTLANSAGATVGASFGGPIATGSGNIYTGFSGAGTVMSFADSSLLADTQTIIFQLEFSFFEGQTIDDLDVRLLFGDNEYQADFFAKVGDGTVLTSSNGTNYGEVYAFQWDVSNKGTLPSNYSIAADFELHQSIFGAQLETSSMQSGDLISAQAVPEPSTALLGAIGLGSLVLRRRRKR